MLEFIKIENLALLDEAQIDFHEGFTVLTGETGAGKSVLLGALSLLAGNRGGKEIVKSGRDLCSVEAVLNFKNSDKINEFLSAQELPLCEDGALVLRRTIHSQKAGKAFINGVLSTASTLQRLGEFWIDFHGPGEPQKLFSAKNQLDMLDVFANFKNEKNDYLALLSERNAGLKKIDELVNAKQLSPDEIEFTRLQIQAIEMLNPSEESIAKLEADFRLMENSRELIEKSSLIADAISGEEGVADKLSRILKNSAELSKTGRQGEALHERINSAFIELNDIADSYTDLSDASNFSEEDADGIRRDMDAWLMLRRKYGGSVASVLAAKKSMQEKIELQGGVKESVAKLRERIDILEKQMAALSEKILRAREKTSQVLALKVEGLLKSLGFKKPQFEIRVKKIEDFNLSCGSVCEFEFSANPGQAVLPLAKIASSGELARVMLSIKTAMAEADETPILVFDEVDANVGGEIGAEVGKELSKLAKAHQVFCVTHLPQVAAFGQNHLFIEKFQTDTDTSVKISELTKTGKDRIQEISRMLGDRASASAAKHAKELLQLASSK